MVHSPVLIPVQSMAKNAMARGPAEAITKYKNEIFR
jgi:hypothetical protein